MDRHIRILGILNIALGSLSIVGGLLALLVLGSTAGAMILNSQEALPVTASTVAALAVAMGIFLICLGLPAVIAGFGLLSYRPWARTFTLVLSFFHLFHMPFGTALGVYGFWVLFSDEAQRIFALRGPGGTLAVTR